MTYTQLTFFILRRLIVPSSRLRHQIERILQDLDGEPVNIFKFIINPNDFGQSVENLFYLSFLIRDGKCAFSVDEESGEPTISESFPATLCCS